MLSASLNGVQSSSCVVQWAWQLSCLNAVVNARDMLQSSCQNTSSSPTSVLHSASLVIWSRWQDSSSTVTPIHIERCRVLRRSIPSVCGIGRLVGQPRTHASVSRQPFDEMVRATPAGKTHTSSHGWQPTGGLCAHQRRAYSAELVVGRRSSRHRRLNRTSES